MYGSQTHFEQNQKIESLKNRNFKKSKITSKDLKIIITTMALIAVANISFAGPKQPKLAGGNGNAQGR